MLGGIERLQQLAEACWWQGQEGRRVGKVSKMCGTCTTASGDSSGSDGSSSSDSSSSHWAKKLAELLPEAVQTAEAVIDGGWVVVVWLRA
jgi:hypothetical protein